MYRALGFKLEGCGDIYQRKSVIQVKLLLILALS